MHSNAEGPKALGSSSNDRRLSLWTPRPEMLSRTLAGNSPDTSMRDVQADRRRAGSNASLSLSRLLRYDAQRRRALQGQHLPELLGSSHGLRSNLDPRATSEGGP